MSQNLPAIYVYGAGAHGLVVAEAAEAAGHVVRGFIDDKPQNEALERWPVIRQGSIDTTGAGVIVAIGDNVARRRICADLAEAGWRLLNVIHPTACISPSSLLGSGIYVGPHAVISARCDIGNGVIVNSGAVVEHHCVVRPFVHLAPRCVLGHGCEVDALAMVGIGAAVAAGVRVGQGATIGAAAGVEQDVPDHKTALGVPATIRGA
jgi:UDP-N-acetylbacillosamine N-acetyltransferase